jgi:hypothetical protein
MMRTTAAPPNPSSNSQVACLSESAGDRRDVPDYPRILVDVLFVMEVAYAGASRATDGNHSA